MAVAAPLLVASEKDLFHMPQVDDFRLQVVEKSAGEAGWPFTVDRGKLACAYVLGQRVVYFVEEIAGEGEEARVTQVSVNPFDLSLGPLAKSDLIRADLSLEDRIRGMGPLVTIGMRLCDQPRGTTIGPGEL
jgi:hypothetical protein